MAKGNLFLGQARGKVGSVVFARAFGEQITRTRPTSVANPKTLAQNTQRAILATIAKEAALLTPIVDHSFANVTYGAASVRHFRKLNMGILRNMLLSSVGNNYNLSAKGAGAVPNALKVSEGNLPAFSSAYQDDKIGFYMGAALSSISECTVSDFKTSYPYIQNGDQLTLVKIVKTSGSLVDGDAIFALKVDRIVFSPTAFDNPNDIVIDDEGFLNSALLDMNKTTNAQAIQGVDAGGGKGIGCTTDRDNAYAAALILSRKVNNVWQRSTQYLELSEFDDFTDNQAAIASYGANESLNESTEYLNQADEADTSIPASDAYAQISGYDNGNSVYTEQAGVDAILTGVVNAPAGHTVALQINGFSAGDARLIACEILDPQNNSVARGTKYARHTFTMAEAKAGVYKMFAVFSNGTRAEADITVSLQS